MDYTSWNKWQLLIEMRKRKYTESSIAFIMSHGGKEAMRRSLQNDDVHDTIIRVANMQKPYS